MPAIELVKIKIRRGSEYQRQRVVLEQAELAYIIDTKRLFIGDGVLSGGNVIGAYIHTPLTTTGSRVSLTTAQKGDLVYENSLMYQLTGTDYSVLSAWGNVAAKVDNIAIQYNASNQISLKDGSVSISKLSAAGIAGPGLQQTGSGYSPVYDDVTVGLNGSNQLYVKDNAITENRIINTALGNGLQGGSGTKLSVKADPTYFGFLGGMLSLTAVPAPGALTYSQLTPGLFGSGLTLTGTQLIANVQGVDATLTQTGANIGLTNLGSGSTRPLAQITTDSYGRVTANTPSVTTTFKLSAKAGSSANFPLISAFNGYPGQVTGGRMTDIELTVFTVLSSNGSSSVQLNLSSAGFMTFNNTNAADGTVLDRFAVPVFSY